MASKSEGRVAIDAAKGRLAAAKRMQAAINREVEEAESFLRETYEKFEVIDVDDDGSKAKADAGNSGRKRGASVSPEPGRGEEKRARAASASTTPPSSAARSTSNEGSSDSDSGRVDEITVEGAGTSEANGTYRRRQYCADLPDWVDKECPVFTKTGSWKGYDGEFLVWRSVRASWWLSCRRRKDGKLVHFYTASTRQTLPRTWSLALCLDAKGIRPTPQVNW